MSADLDRIVRTFTAGGTITKFAAVALDDDGLVTVDVDPDGTDPMFIGIAQEAAVAGDLVSVAIAGVSKAVAGTGGISTGGGTVFVMVEAAGSGGLVPHAFAAGAAPNLLVGRVLQTAAQSLKISAGDIMEILINPVYLRTA